MTKFSIYLKYDKSVFKAIVRVQRIYTNFNPSDELHDIFIYFKYKEGCTPLF